MLGFSFVFIGHHKFIGFTLQVYRDSTTVCTIRNYRRNCTKCAEKYSPYMYKLCKVGQYTSVNVVYSSAVYLYIYQLLYLCVWPEQLMCAVMELQGVSRELRKSMGLLHSSKSIPGPIIRWQKFPDIGTFWYLMDNMNINVF